MYRIKTNWGKDRFKVTRIAGDPDGIIGINVEL